MTKNILIVEDDRTVLNTLKEILELEGYKVDTAETGKEAVEKTKSKSYNLTLLDIKLPDMRNTTLLKTIHKINSKTMKIMLTGLFENVVEYLKHGANTYIVKPVDPEKLLSIIEEELRK